LASVSPTLSSYESLQREWLPLRARLLDIAATLDRLDRQHALAVDSNESQTIQEALRLLTSSEPNRAEQLQQLYSRPYDPAWRERFAAGENSADPPASTGEAS
jgi:hypothetical protein